MATRSKDRRPRARTVVRPAGAGRRRPDGALIGSGGSRLAEALEAAGTLPALDESQARLVALTRREPVNEEQIVAVVETDAALSMGVLRAANEPATANVSSVPQAVGHLGPAAVAEAVHPLPTYSLFDGAAPGQGSPEQFRRHALATRHASERVAEIGDAGPVDEIALTALLHDVGQLPLRHLYPAYPELLDDPGLTPERRVDRERRELGVDHALLGGVLLRRWGLPQVVAGAVERHHDPEARGAAAIVRLADSIAHHRSGRPIETAEIEQAAQSCGLDGEGIRMLLAEDPYRRPVRRLPRRPSPLSARELSALQGLAEGKVYKQIAAELGLSASTIRSHLHNAYRKIGVSDRAQAVLLAREHGWI